MKFLLICLSCCVLNAQVTVQPGRTDLRAVQGQPRVLNVFRWPGVPYPYSKSWAVATYITQHGDIETDASVTISGVHAETPDAHGYYPVRRPLPNYMLGIISDVNAPTIVVQGNQLPASSVLVVLDPRTARENLRIGNDGVIWLKSVEMTDGPTTNATVGKEIWTIRGGIIREIKPRRVTLPPTTLMRGKHIERRRP